MHGAEEEKKKLSLKRNSVGRKPRAILRRDEKMGLV